MNCSKMRLALFAAMLGACSAYGDIQIFEVDSVAALTNAIDRANSSPSDSGAAYDVIRLKAGVTFDLSTLSEYTSSDALWGTMCAPANTDYGKSCIWFKKKIHFEGEDATHWKAKTSAQESVLYGGSAAWMNSAVDLAGNARIFDDVVDIGCYECLLSAPSGMTIIVW